MSKGVPAPLALSAFRLPPSSLLFLGNLQQVQSPTVGAQHLQGEIIDVDLLAALGHPPEARHDEPADGVEFLIAEVGAECGVDVGDLGERLYAVLPSLFGHDIVLDVVEIVLVLDIANNLLDDVFYR